jgi:hypothetical protein
MRAFLQFESIFVGLGAAAIAVLELGFVPTGGALHDFTVDYRFWIYLFAGALIFIPPILAQGLRELAELKDAKYRQAEMSTALVALQSRTTHLVPKILEVANGQRDNTYLHHSLSECRSLFQARRHVAGSRVDMDQPFMEVAFYAYSTQQGAAKLTRKACAGNTPHGLKGELSSGHKAKGTTLAREMIDLLVSGSDVWFEDLTPSEKMDLGIDAKRFTDFECALGVPVFNGLDPKDGLLGMIIATSSTKKALVLSDGQLLRSYAWFLTVSRTLENS